jgi:hypothetical protein
MRGLAGSCAVYLKVSALILITSAAAKVITLLDGRPVLLTFDAVTGVQLRWLFAIEAFLELALSIFITLGKSQKIKLLALFWVGWIFCSYHLAKALLNPAQPCPCLGLLYGRIGLSPVTMDLIAKTIATFFLLGPSSLWFLGRTCRNTKSLDYPSLAQR